MKKARSPELRWYAAIPILFGIQQLIEGFQWMADKPGLCSTALGYGFLFFAFLLWPTYVPFAAWRMEADPFRRRLLRILTFLGAAITLFLLYTLLSRDLRIEVLARGIFYHVEVPATFESLTLYVAAVCGSASLSTRPGFRLFGIATFVGFLAALIVWNITFTSVWCFFAAALSVIIAVDVIRNPKKKGRH